MADPDLSLRRLARDAPPAPRAWGYEAWSWILAAAAAVLATTLIVTGDAEAFRPGAVQEAHRVGSATPSGCGDCHAAPASSGHAGCVLCHELEAEPRHEPAACGRCHPEHAGRVRAAEPMGCADADCHEAHDPPAAVVQEASEPRARTRSFSHQEHLAKPVEEEAPTCPDCHAAAEGAPGLFPWPTYEDCICCHEDWAVEDHGFETSCQACHEEHGLGSEPPPSEVGNAADLPDRPQLECAICHDRRELFAGSRAELAPRRVPGFSHATVEHGVQSCEACHPGVGEQAKGAAVATALPESETCRACHGLRPDAGCAVCHPFHAEAGAD